MMWSQVINIYVLIIIFLPLVHMNTHIVSMWVWVCKHAAQCVCYCLEHNIHTHTQLMWWVFLFENDFSDISQLKWTIFVLSIFLFFFILLLCRLYLIFIATTKFDRHYFASLKLFKLIIIILPLGRHTHTGKHFFFLCWWGDVKDLYSPKQESKWRYIRYLR